MIKYIKRGLSQYYLKEECLPQYGQQSFGVSPKGLLDQSAYRDACALLGEQTDCIEFIMPPKLSFNKTCSFVIAGAPYEEMCLDDEKLTRLKVYHAKQDQVLSFKKKLKGFRTYLCLIEGEKDLKQNQRTYLERNPQFDSLSYIRITKGPEYKHLENPRDFLDESWQIGLQTSAMGIQLANYAKPLQCDHQMISAPVADGTIQLTPSGPFILMRHRQTVGGYPRIFNVISEDIDVLAQKAPRQFLRFKLV